MVSGKSDKDKDRDKSEKDLRLSDLLKKAVNTGVGAAFMAEDAVKSMLSDVKLPTDVLDGLLKNAKATKTEFISAIKTELKGYLNKVDLSREIEKVLQKYDFEVKATISLKRKDGTTVSEAVSSSTSTSTSTSAKVDPDGES